MPLSVLKIQNEIIYSICHTNKTNLLVALIIFIYVLALEFIFIPNIQYVIKTKHSTSSRKYASIAEHF